MATTWKRGPFWPLSAAAFAMAAALSGGCSLIFRVDASQCSTTADCTGRGPLFASTVCSAGTCIAKVVEAGIVDAGAEAEAGGCNTQADCAMVGNPMYQHACDVDTHTCVQLTSADCPLIIPPDFATLGTNPPPPIFIGAFASIPQVGPSSDPSTLNYLLALNEFRNAGGIPAGPNTAPGSAQRLPVAIGCSVAPSGIDTAMQHLISDVHVHSIITALPAPSIVHVFATYASANTPSKSVFMINPFGADSTLTSSTLQTNGLLWHMLGSPVDTAPAYAAFLPLVEKYIRNNPPWNLGPTAPMKIDVVKAPSATGTSDLASAVEKVLVWNGGASTPLDSVNYHQYSLTSSYLDGTTDLTVLANEAGPVAAQIAADAPHLVISFASEEFAYVLSNVELDWTGSLLPFYLVGPYNYGSSLLQGDIANPQNPIDIRKRMAGINWASTTDPQVLNDYESRFLAANMSRQDALGQENYYDAMYFAVYSLVGAGRVIPDGKHISQGMELLVTGTTQYTVGPGGDMASIFGALGNQGSVSLIGTLGPPNFNLANGARISEGDVYCYGQTDGGITPYVADALRLANADGGAAPDGGGALQGKFPCYSGIQ